ncbi:MAG: hypothetical protein AB8B50_02495 [Pirellulaceae bacterium]
MKFPRKRTLAYIAIGLLLFVAVSVWGGIQFVKSRFFAETPNRLSIVGDAASVPFEWATNRHEDYFEQHGAILLPVTVPGIEKQLYVQLDTGAPSSFLRSGCMESLAERGLEFELYTDDKTTRVKHFELDVGDSRVALDGGWVMKREIFIDWEEPYNVIGSLGADFIDGRVCAIDFPAKQLHLRKERTEEFNSLGKYETFRFPGRRILLPAQIQGKDCELLYDSGCSPFGLITSKYHFDRYADENTEALQLDLNAFGNGIPIHHQACSLEVSFGEAAVPIKRVSYVDKYSGMQSLFGGFIDGGFMGNKFLLESTLILDVKAKEFLLVQGSIESSADELAASEKDDGDPAAKSPE